MGHLGHLKQEYRDLVRRLDAGSVGLPEPEDPAAWAGWKEILEILYTPEEATIASRMPVMPASLHRVAAQVGMSVEALRPRLERMADKGLVMDLISPSTGKTRWMLAPPVIGFFEFSLMRAKDDNIDQAAIAKAMGAYMYGDPAFANDVFGGETVVGRALAHEQGLADDQPEVLDWERARAIVNGAARHAVSLCYCRHKAEHLGHACGAPQEVCMSLDAGADFVIRRSFGREITRQEALELLEVAREHKLVHIADNVQQRPVYICSCCGCCCGQLSAINQWDLPAVVPSGFLPSHQDEACTGCSRCARACPISAISMDAVRVRGSAKNTLRPAVNEDRCIGCGVCAIACTRGAMTLRRGEQRRTVPQNAIDRSIRVAMERGRLAHLIVDEGASRGHRFLNAALRALTRLPAAERALASEQLKSRFVAQALKAVKDPMA